MGPIVVSHMRLLLAIMVEEDLVALVIKLMPLRHPFQTSHPDLVGTATTIVHLVSSLQRENVEMVPIASFLTIAVVAVVVDLGIKIQRLEEEALDQLLPQVHSVVDRLLLLRRQVHSVEAEQHLPLARLVVEEGLHRHLHLVLSEEVDRRQLQVHLGVDLVVVLLPLLDLLCRIVIILSEDLDDKDKRFTFVVVGRYTWQISTDVKCSRVQRKKSLLSPT